MITIKLPYTTSKEEKNFIDEIRRQTSIVTRYAYNRFLEEKDEKETRLLCKDLKSINDIDSWFVQCAIKEAKQIKNSQEALKIDKIIFGKKFNFYKRIEGKISKEELKQFRLMSIVSQGEKDKNGNRKFDLDIDNNKIIFKFNKNKHIDLFFPKVKKNYKRKLIKLQELSNKKEYCYQVRIDKNYIYISFDEFREENADLVDERFASIDMNPNYIGVSIQQKDRNKFEILKTFYYDLKKLNKNKNNNKINNEIIMISKNIVNIVNNNCCKYLILENLDHIDGKNHNKGRWFNKLINNDWKRTLFVDNVVKRCNEFKIVVKKVYSQYSSFIGNLQYDYFDPISSSLEVGRRGYGVLVQRDKKQFYPRFDVKDSMTDLWKEYGVEFIEDWKELYRRVKNSKLRYRVSLEESMKVHSLRVFSMNNIKSDVFVNSFL